MGGTAKRTRALCTTAGTRTAARATTLGQSRIATKRSGSTSQGSCPGWASSYADVTRPMGLETVLSRSASFLGSAAISLRAA